MTDIDRFASEVVDLHQRLVRATFVLSGDRDLAEDSAQEALLRAWQRLGDGHRIDSLEAWCLTVALNWCRSALRRTTSERQKTERLRARDVGRVHADVASGAAGDELDEEVRVAVLGLPPRQREVVVLHYLLDMGIAEIASTVGRSQGAVKNALYHARVSLSRGLQRTASTMGDTS